MKNQIKIYKRDRKFCFTVDKFSSLKHACLTRYAHENYRYAWEAQRDARNIAKNYKYHLAVLEKFAIEDLSKPIIEDMSSERKIADHYEDVYDGLVDVATGMDKDDKNQKKVNYFEAKAVVQEILFIIEKMPEDEFADEEEQSVSKDRLEKIIDKIKDLVHKYYMEDLKEDEKKSKEKAEEQPPSVDMGMPPMDDSMGDMGMPPMDDMGGMPMASSNALIKVAQSYEDDLDEEMIEDLFNEYGERACKAIENKHPGCLWIKRPNGIDIIDNHEIILALDIGEDLFLENIRPIGTIESMYPYHSAQFYQAYWKPIVESIGHCCVGDNTSVLEVSKRSLPDIVNEDNVESKMFEAISKDSKKIVPFTVSFKGDPISWFIKEKKFEKSASSKYTKEDYYKNGKGAIVICTDPELKSYYKNTGQVIQVIPFSDHLEVDVDFGNHIFRMVESQFDIIDEL